jgi:hypothetical protein
MAVTDILSQVITFTLTASTIQSLYYSKITVITAVKITGAQLFTFMSVFCLLEWVCHHGVCTQNKRQREINANKPHGPN